MQTTYWDLVTCLLQMDEVEGEKRQLGFVLDTFLDRLWWTV